MSWCSVLSIADESFLMLSKGNALIARAGVGHVLEPFSAVTERPKALQTFGGKQ